MPGTTPTEFLSMVNMEVSHEYVAVRVIMFAFLMIAALVASTWSETFATSILAASVPTAWFGIRLARQAYRTDGSLDLVKMAVSLALSHQKRIPTRIRIYAHHPYAIAPIWGFRCSAEYGPGEVIHMTFQVRPRFGFLKPKILSASTRKSAADSDYDF